MSSEGFLSRWSRRKAGVQGSGLPSETPVSPVHPHPNPLPLTQEREPTSLATQGRGIEGEGLAPVDAPPPTMDDVAQLTRDSDFSRFVAPDVDEGVKRAAMKKLFSDPHFNVMDGLDTYVEDYSQPDPIPEAMLRRMAQAQVLGLFDDEEKEPPSPKASPDGEAALPVPQSPAEPELTADEDPDLRLQQDDAAGPAGPEPGAPA